MKKWKREEFRFYFPVFPKCSSKRFLLVIKVLLFSSLSSPPIHVFMCLWAPVCRTCRTAGSGYQSPVTAARRPSSAGGRGTSLYRWLRKNKNYN